MFHVLLSSSLRIKHIQVRHISKPRRIFVRNVIIAILHKTGRVICNIFVIIISSEKFDVKKKALSVCHELSTWKLYIMTDTPTILRFLDLSCSFFATVIKCNKIGFCYLYIRTIEMKTPFM